MKDKPLDSYIQVFMIFAWVGGILTLFAVLTDISIWNFFTALGAASAVILLIFKDTILGLVASIQVSINDMVLIGDWITFEKFGADGNVTEISLARPLLQFLPIHLFRIRSKTGGECRLREAVGLNAPCL